MGTETLRNLARGIVFQLESADLWLLALLLVVGVFVVASVFGLAVRVRRLKRPKPHGGQTSVSLKTCCIGTFEDQGQSLLGDGSPNVLQVFAQRDGHAACLLYARISREDFQCWTETGKDGICSHYAFTGEAWHPFVDAEG